MNALFESIHTGTVTVTTYLIGIAAALLCGVIAALCTAYRSHVTKSFLISLVLLPMIVQTVITMVNGNVGTGVAVMGAFSLARVSPSSTEEVKRKADAARKRRENSSFSPPA